jgi:hypothetical protein
MAGDKMKDDSPTTHMEEIAHEKNLAGEPQLLHGGPPETTLYQVVFSVFVGIAGWMYNFDLVSLSCDVKVRPG